MIRLLCVLGHGHELLPHFIEHYTKHVDELQFVIYESKASPRILSRAKPIIEKYDNCKIVKVVREREFDWEKVTILYNMFKSKKKNDWWVIADIDEFHLYPNNNLETLIDDCEKNLWTIVRGGFIDRVGPNGTFPKIPPKETSLFKTFPMAGFFRYPMSGANPNKVTLMKGSVDLVPGQHYAIVDGKNSWGTEHKKRMPIQDVFVQVHHFKWDSSVLDRILEVAGTKKNYTFWQEYDKMYQSIVKENNQINIKNTDYLVEELKNNSYIEYKDYPHWDKLVKTITNI